jgi:hypothetical protein
MPPRVRMSSASEDRRTWGCAFQLNGLTEARIARCRGSPAAATVDHRRDSPP